MLQDIREGFPGLGPVIRVDQGETACPPHLLGAVSEHPLDRWAGKPNDSVAIELRDDIDTIFNQPAVSVHAPLEVAPRLRAVAPPPGRFRAIS